MFKILNVIEEGRFGGPQNRIVQVSKALNPEVETIVVMPELDSEKFYSECEKMGVEVFRAKLTRLSKEKKVLFKYIFLSVYEIFKLYQLFRDSDANLVHVSGGSWQIKGLLASKLARKKVVWHLNDTSMPRAVRLVFKVLSPLATGFIFASERSKKYYSPLMPDQSISAVIPAPVNCSFFVNNETNYDFEGRSIKVGTVCNINPTKGIELLFKVANLCKKNNLPIEFYVAGPVHKSQARFIENLKRRYSYDSNNSNINFLGNVDDVKGFLETIDVYGCFSRFESSPLSVWEAMSMKMPIISTDVGDVSLYVEDGSNGFIVPPEDEGLFFERLCDLINSKGNLYKFGGSSREIALKKLDVNYIAKLHSKFYSEIDSL